MRGGLGIASHPCNYTHFSGYLNLCLKFLESAINNCLMGGLLVGCIFELNLLKAEKF